MAAIGKTVECDIHFREKGEMALEVPIANEVQAVGFDTVRLELVFETVAGEATGAIEIGDQVMDEKAGAGNTAEDGSNGADDLYVKAHGADEVAKGNVAISGGGEGWNWRGFRRRNIGQVPVGEGELGTEAGGTGPGVGNEIVDGVDAGGGGVAGVGELDWGGAGGVDGEAIVREETGDVEKNVYPVVNDGLVDLFVRQVCHLAGVVAD